MNNGLLLRYLRLLLQGNTISLVPNAGTGYSNWHIAGSPMNRIVVEGMIDYHLLLKVGDVYKISGDGIAEYNRLNAEWTRLERKS